MNIYEAIENGRCMYCGALVEDGENKGPEICPECGGPVYSAYPEDRCYCNNCWMSWTGEEWDDATGGNDVIIEGVL